MEKREKRAHDAAEGGTTVMRRVPQQDRGQRRVEKILDAAAEVIAEVGVDAATTNAIAARAETSVGSLYQFFPNKDAVVQALAARYVEQLKEMKLATFDEVDATQPLPELIETMVCPMVDFHDANPAYQHVYYATNRPDAPYRGDVELKDSIVTLVTNLLGARNPAIPEEERRVCARVMCETVHAISSEMMRASPEDRPLLLRELRNVMFRYLSAMEPGEWGA